MKKFLKDLWNNGLAYDMKVIAVLFAVAIVIVVIVCGIYGNNDQNFWKKDITPVYQIDTTTTQITQVCHY